MSELCGPQRVHTAGQHILFLFLFHSPSARFSCFLTLNESTGSIHQAPTIPRLPRWDGLVSYSNARTHTHTSTQNAFASNDLLFVYDFSIFTVSEFEINHQSFRSFFFAFFLLLLLEYRISIKICYSRWAQAAMRKNVNALLFEIITSYSHALHSSRKQKKCLKGVLV